MCLWGKLGTPCLLVSILWLLGENKQRTLPENRDDFLTIGVRWFDVVEFFEKTSPNFADRGGDYWIYYIWRYFPGVVTLEKFFLWYNYFLIVMPAFAASPPCFFNAIHVLESESFATRVMWTVIQNISKWWSPQLLLIDILFCIYMLVIFVAKQIKWLNFALFLFIHTTCNIFVRVTSVLPGWRDVKWSTILIKYFFF